MLYCLTGCLGGFPGVQRVSPILSLAVPSVTTVFLPNIDRNNVSPQHSLVQRTRHHFRSLVPQSQHSWCGHPGFGPGLWQLWETKAEPWAFQLALWPWTDDLALGLPTSFVMCEMEVLTLASFTLWINLKAFMKPERAEGRVFRPGFALVQNDVNFVEYRGVRKGHVTPTAWPGGPW